MKLKINLKWCFQLIPLKHITFLPVYHLFGANTGVGGRIRDTIAIGKGGNIISDTVDIV